MSKHKNIPIFIPHNGCPNQCVFCNQKTISGSGGYTFSKIKEQIEQTLLHLNPEDTVEIAFFGGSFTGIPRKEMTALLALANTYLVNKRIHGIRLSTRPDYISSEILDILADYGVTDIELGVQSLSDTVLTACARGHNADQTRMACRLIKERKQFSLVGQMMLGLPSSTREAEFETARELLELGVDAIRIYPTLVLENTPLSHQLLTGDYLPLTLEEAIERAADILELMDTRHIPCLRVGLCENETLHNKDGMLAGPFHPAFGELAMSRVFFRRFCKLFQNCQTEDKEFEILIPKGSLSKAIGQKRNNLIRLQQLYHIKKIRFTESENLTGYCVYLQEDHCIASQIT